MREGEELKTFSKLVTLLIMLMPLATAQQPQTRVFREGGNWAQEITGSLTAARNLKVKVDVGSVRVQGGSQQAIDYVIHTRAYTSSEDKARREFDAFKISAYVRGDTAFLVAEWEGSSPRKFSGDFVLNVPRNIDSVKVETDGGSVTGTGIAGRMDATSGGGSIHFDDIGGATSAETGGGSMELNGVPSARAETGGGGIVAKFVPSTGERTDSVLETSAGDITVYLVSNLNISIRASIEMANGHKIHSDFPEIRITTEGDEGEPKTITGEGDLNGGGPVLKVRTTTGDIWLRRASR